MDGTLHHRDFHAWTREQAAACPFTLDELLDEEAPLDALLARLTPEP